ncbi:MAG: hypothetical protein J6X95_02020 [Treponema sp.]|nr:hypothetical protein [Treponema sp.]
MKRILTAILAAAAISFAPAELLAAGYPVFDMENWLSAIDRLYANYDMVKNTISQIENQYKQIQQAVERAKSIDWQNIRWDGDFDIRGEIKDAGKRVNRLLSQAKNIQMAITKPSINCGNAKYSIADLCGFTHPDPENGLWESRKNLLTAITDYKTYMTDNVQGAVDDLVKGLNYKQKEAIMRKYGVSPRNYLLTQTAHVEVLKAANNILANINDEAKSARLGETILRNNMVIQACLETTDSDGNPTMAGMQESMLYLFNNLSVGIEELRSTMYETGGMAASAAIEQDTREQVKANESKEQTEMNKIKNAAISNRATR